MSAWAKNRQCFFAGPTNGPYSSDIFLIKPHLSTPITVFEFKRMEIVNNQETVLQKMDNGGRRSGIDLRQFSYAGHIPERRSQQDRRSGHDRRSGVERRNHEDRRRSTNEDGKKTANANIIEMRNFKERRQKRRRAVFDN